MSLPLNVKVEKGGERNEIQFLCNATQENPSYHTTQTKSQPFFYAKTMAINLANPASLWAQTTRPLRVLVGGLSIR